MDAANRTHRDRFARRRARWALAIVPLIQAACATGGGVQLGAPEDLPALEARLARDSTDVEALVGVAAGLRARGQPAAAVPLLERARRQDPEDGTATVMLGLAHEDAGDHAAALRVYEEYVRVAQSEALREQIRRRIPLVTRNRLLAEVKAIATEERALAGAPAPHTVAIFPYLTDDIDGELRPLGRAMAEMLATDLGRNGRITVVERAAVTMLLEELAFQRSDWVDPATAQRSGQLLSAGVVVQGQIDGTPERLVLETAIVDAVRGASVQPAQLRHEDAIDRLFDLERQLALQIIGSMGIELTPAERERIVARPTQSLQALLAYGRGLEASDAGQFEDAAAHFSEAVRLDRGFGEARASADRAADAAAAAATTTDELAAQAGEESAAFGDALGAVEVLVPSVGGRDAAVEALGAEGLGRRTILEIIIRGN